MPKEQRIFDEVEKGNTTTVVIRSLDLKSLPDSYFTPKGVDKFVEKMNKDFDYSALKIPGKQTIRVATFRGRGTLVGASQSRSSKTRRKNADTDPLMEAAENAHLLCEEMRRKGWEAYEFHDTTESWVSVGSFSRSANCN